MIGNTMACNDVRLLTAPGGLPASIDYRLTALLEKQKKKQKDEGLAHRVLRVAF